MSVLAAQINKKTLKSPEPMVSEMLAESQNFRATTDDVRTPGSVKSLSPSFVAVEEQIVRDQEILPLVMILAWSCVMIRVDVVVIRTKGSTFRT